MEAPSLRLNTTTLRCSSCLRTLPLKSLDLAEIPCDALAWLQIPYAGYGQDYLAHGAGMPYVQPVVSPWLAHRVSRINHDAASRA